MRGLFSAGMAVVEKVLSQRPPFSRAAAAVVAGDRSDVEDDEPVALEGWRAAPH